MTLAGSIQIDLAHHSGVVSQVQINSSRPDTATLVLLGKTPDQLLHIVPLLFSLCGNAQAYAALQACRAAMGQVAQPNVDAAQRLLVQLETLREHSWRILLDWPGLIGQSPNKTAIAALLKFDALFKQMLFKNAEAFNLDSGINKDAPALEQPINDLENLIDTAIFNGGLSDFLSLHSETELSIWLQQNSALSAQLLNAVYQQACPSIGQNPIHCLPELAAEDLLWQMQQTGLAEFVQSPNWLGQSFESTLLNRQLAQQLLIDLHKRYGNGLLVRLVGRLLEVAGIPAQLRQLSALVMEKSASPKLQTLSDGIGLAQVQAARGLLIHRLVLRQGRVYDYRIVAPTEWNFHKQGVVAQSLMQLQADGAGQLQQQADLLINAIDPCVPYQLNLIDE